MSLYFNNSKFKLDRVLNQNEKNTSIINELARRVNISKAEKGKKRRRKSKNKGKHRKGKKGVKQTSEITIDNQPTQQVKGYSVVNVISAKRGPYKKGRGDLGMGGGQTPFGNNYRGKKGRFGAGDRSRYDQSAGTGLVKGSSDDRYAGDPKDRETLAGLRRQVDRIEQRLMGGGNQPAQVNQAGPLAPPGGGLLPPPAAPAGLPRAIGRPSPRVVAPKGKGGAPPPPAFVRPPKVANVKPASPKLDFASELKKQLEKGKTPSQLRAEAAAARRLKEAQKGTPRLKMTKSQLIAGGDAVPLIQPPLLLTLKSGESETTTPSASPRLTPTPPRTPGFGTSPREKLAEAKHYALTGKAKPPPPPSTIGDDASEPGGGKYVAPADVGQMVGQSAQAANSGRYGNFKPPTPFQVKGRARTSKANPQLTPEWYDLDNERKQISSTLFRDKRIPDDFFMKRKGVVREERPGEVQLLNKERDIIKWAKSNKDEGEAKFIESQVKRWTEIRNEQSGLVKAEKTKLKTSIFTGKPLDTLYEQVSSPNVSGGSAAGEIGSSSVIADASDSGAGIGDLGSSAVLVSPTETVPVPSNINPSNVGEAVGAAASSVASGAGQLGQAVVVGAAGVAGGMLQGVAQQIVGQLPTSATVGRVIGQGAVMGAGALVGAAGGALSGGYQMVNQPAIGPDIQAEIVAQPAEPEPEFQGFPQQYVGTDEFS